MVIHARERSGRRHGNRNYFRRPDFQTENIIDETIEFAQDELDDAIEASEVN